MKDRNFDDLCDHFERKIYQSEKGRLRLALLNEDLKTQLPELQHRKLHILDAGCGLGQLGLQFLGQGHQLVFSDVSKRMLEAVQTRSRDVHGHQQAKFVHSDVQSLPSKVSVAYDLVLFHAVLEWLASPLEGLQAAAALVKPGGVLSLMFYNRDGLTFRNLVRGNLRKVKSGQYRGDHKSLTPINPLTLSEVHRWLAELGLEVRSTSGIRVFYDYMSKEARERISFDDILEMELALFQTPPYANMGRYLHLVCIKPV